MQTFGLLRVCVSKRLRSSFEEVLVVAHLGYWHAVELVWTGDREIHMEGEFDTFCSYRIN